MYLALLAQKTQKLEDGQADDPAEARVNARVCAVVSVRVFMHTHKGGEPCSHRGWGLCNHLFVIVEMCSTSGVVIFYHVSFAGCGLRVAPTKTYSSATTAQKERENNGMLQQAHTQRKKLF